MATFQRNEASGYYKTSVPKPVIDHLGKGREVDAIKYAIKGTRVEIRVPESDR